MIMELLLLAVLVILGYLAFQKWSSGQMGSKSPESASPGPGTGGIEQVGPGGVIQLPPHGPDMQELDVQVTARHVYDQDGYQWYELEGESGGGTVWLDVERDDELETSITLRRLRLDELGLEEDAVDDLRSGATVQFEGQSFRMEERGRARFWPNGNQSRAEDLEFWDFEGDDDRHDLSIERWGGQEYRAYLSQRIPPARIKVYRVSDAT